MVNVVGEAKDLGWIARMKASRNAFEHQKGVDPHGTLVTIAHLAAGIGLVGGAALIPPLFLPAHKAGRTGILPDKDSWISHAATVGEIGAGLVIVITAGSQITHGRSPLTPGVAPIYGLAVGGFGASWFGAGAVNEFMKN